MNASVQRVTKAPQVGMRMQRQFTSTHRHARVGANDTSKKVKQTTWVHQVVQAMEDQLETDELELMTREHRKKAKDAKRICGIVHDSDRKKGTSQARDEMVQLMHHEEQKLLGLWEGDCRRVRAGLWGIVGHPFGFLPLFRIVLHATLIISRALNFRSTLYAIPLFLVSVPFDLPLAAATPQGRFSDGFSLEKEGLSRFFYCSV